MVLYFKISPNNRVNSLWEDILNEEEDTESVPGNDNSSYSDVTHLNFTAHIAEQNKLRSEYFKGLTFGDPIWDVLLDIYVSEKTDQSTTIGAISDRQERSKSLCQRCVDYLLERDAVFENFNRYTAPKFRYLASEKTKQQIAAWLNNCLASAP
ncbi:MAG: hypothetical protein Pars92KO_16360 [Parasphingorhabdus sp.]